jgi:hypothetical protein
MKTTLILCSILGASMLAACGGSSSTTAIREDQKRKPADTPIQSPDDAFSSSRQLQSGSGAAGVEPPKKN